MIKTISLDATVSSIERDLFLPTHLVMALAEISKTSSPHASCLCVGIYIPLLSTRREKPVASANIFFLVVVDDIVIADGSKFTKLFLFILFYFFV